MTKKQEWTLENFRDIYARILCNGKPIHPGTIDPQIAESILKEHTKQERGEEAALRMIGGYISGECSSEKVTNLLDNLLREYRSLKKELDDFDQEGRGQAKRQGSGGRQSYQAGEISSL